jgi:hypothetical protein
MEIEEEKEMKILNFRDPGFWIRIRNKTSADLSRWFQVRSD